MTRPLRARLAGAFLALGLTASASGSAFAEPAASFTPQQRTEIVSILRQALKDDPTILSDAIAALRQGAQQKAADDAISHVRSDREHLQKGPDYTVRGNPSGDLTIVEFLDPRCGYCRSMVPVIDALLKSDPKLRLVEKLVPVLSEKSVLDTQAIFAAALQGGYDKMKRALMQDTAPPTLDRIRQLATANSLNADRLVADMHAPEVAAQINENLAEARLIGLDGTPTFVFGTSAIIPGAISAEEMRTQIKTARTAH
ncbi:DsbA family protein [Asaia prunellae]|uniref:DsbA family protein n=1 Tax=Asaia prunellae TaxID=610245 RepID=UPI00046EAC3E|nr:DsbA family protein [Asaia prunellae]